MLRLGVGRRALLSAGALIASLTAAGAAIYALNWPDLADQRQRMEAITVVDASGTFAGTLARRDGLITRDAAGVAQPRVTIASDRVPDDFWRAASVLEGKAFSVSTLGTSFAE